MVREVAARSPSAASNASLHADPSASSPATSASLTSPKATAAALPDESSAPTASTSAAPMTVDPSATGLTEEGDGYGTESDSDADEDLEEPGWDGIRRRKVKVDGRGRPRPSYYYPSETTARGVPVFEPTMEQFGDFYAFINTIDRYGMRSGIVKVVPPAEWSEALPNVSDQLRMVRMRDPIEQHFMGTGGLFRCNNVAKGKLWNAKLWKEETALPKYATPDFFNVVDRSERDPHPNKRVKRTKRATTTKAATDPVSEPADAPPSEPPSTPAGAVIEGEEEMKLASVDGVTPSFVAVAPAPTPVSKPKAPRKSAATRNVEPTDKEWDAFEGEWDRLPHDAKPTDFTVEACREIERRYWRSLSIGEPPMYGADMHGSLFTSKTTKWNVAHLDNLLTRMKTSADIAGVTTPYLYFGMWRATFSWHVEDADLYSINYIHHGAPKHWYSVPQEHADRFERAMANWFSVDSRKCPEFLRHKSFLASPKMIAQQSIPLNKVVQLPGEFILTYPHGYHSGFNLGYNCAESLNFATETWLEIGRQAKACTCVADSVTINVDAWLEEARTEAERAALKRKLDPALAESTSRYGRVVKPKIDYDEDRVPAYRPSDRAQKQTQAKRKQAEAIPIVPDFACVFCPDMSTEGLIPLAPVPEGRTLSAQIAPRRKAGHAHKTCLLYLPTTWVDVDPETGSELGHGFETVEPARWALNCFVCTDKTAARYGAKVQCTKTAKCVRAVHPTCGFAEDSGVHMDLVEVRGGREVSLLGDRTDPAAVINAGSPQKTSPVIGPPATASIGLEAASGPEGSTRTIVLCRQHNPEYLKQQKLKAAAELAVRIASCRIGCRLNIRASGGVYATLLVENVPERESVKVQYDSGELKMVRTSAIVWGDVDPMAFRSARTAVPQSQQAPHNPYGRAYNTSTRGPAPPIAPYHAYSAPPPPAYYYAPPPPPQQQPVYASYPVQPQHYYHQPSIPQQPQYAYAPPQQPQPTMYAPSDFHLPPPS